MIKLDRDLLVKIKNLVVISLFVEERFPPRKGSKLDFRLLRMANIALQRKILGAEDVFLFVFAECVLIGDNPITSFGFPESLEFVIVKGFRDDICQPLKPISDLVDSSDGEGIEFRAMEKLAFEEERERYLRMLQVKATGFIDGWLFSKYPNTRVQMDDPYQGLAWWVGAIEN